MAQNPRFRLFGVLKEYADMQREENKTPDQIQRRNEHSNSGFFQSNPQNFNGETIISHTSNNSFKDEKYGQFGPNDNVQEVNHHSNSKLWDIEKPKTLSRPLEIIRIASSERSKKSPERTYFDDFQYPMKTSDYITDEITKKTTKIKVDRGFNTSNDHQNSSKQELGNSIQKEKPSVIKPQQRQSLPARTEDAWDNSSLSELATSNLLDGSILDRCVDEREFAKHRPEFKDNYERFANKCGEFSRRYHLQRLVYLQKHKIQPIRNDFRCNEQEKKEKLSEICQKIIMQYNIETSELSNVKEITEEDVRKEMTRLDLTGWNPTDLFKLLDYYFDG